MSIKISELESATSVGGTDVLPIVQNGTTKKVEASLLGAKITYGTTDLTPRRIRACRGRSISLLRIEVMRYEYRSLCRYSNLLYTSRIH